MVSDWVSLSEVCEIRRGSSPRPIVNFTSEITGMPWVKIADATADESRYITKTNQFIKPEGVSKSVIVEKGDLILSNSGTAGLPKFMGITACIHDGWQVLKNLDGITSEYLYYSLIHIRPFLLHHAYDSVMKNLTLDMVRNARIKLPPLPEQKAIAHILGSLDDKIELNRQMNETLEAMAQALFKSWFVDFDPVIDNALAAGNAIPDEFIERAELRKGIEKKENSDIQSLFPDEFEFTEEMGWIPKGWVVIPIYEIADFINGSSFKSKFFSDENEGLPIIKIAEIKNGISQQTKFTTQEMADKYFISDGSIVFSWSGNPDTSIDTFIWTGGDGWLNQHIFNVVLHEDKDKTFIYYLLKSLKPVFTEIARDKQTTGLGHVTVKDMKRTYTIKPSGSTLEAFARQSNPIFEKWYQNLFSSRELIKLRDTLLPKLMSGELRIPDADAMTKEV
ncbi:restriction endonuclease subunit S [Psychrobacter fulvigenes]|uniref:restriction endonuclease subunit S n=1 Tax=Psychrobacter fulvigenes TaxID=533323 RepID=UPI0019191C5F|nr:restriction endonuclease subunit S [Psychrobacter fulvigenes]